MTTHHKPYSRFLSLRILFQIALAHATVCLFFSSSAYATLTADADLRFVNVDSKNDSGVHNWGHSFTQKYSLIYSKQDKLVKGRLGSYDVMLGYELISFDTTISSYNAVTKGNRRTEYDATKGHLLYSGKITIDPKEMPFKLTLYSRDSRRAAISESGTGSNSLDSLSGYDSTFNLTTAVNTGTHLQSGATLIAGVKNGMTNGYNELLRHFPMILLDYRDVINKDSTTDNRLTQLAFVSLNKKENWFHYRYSIYKDKMGPDNDYHESQMQLGTVDQTLQRRWIDFANWLSISADALYINHETNVTANTYQEISLNLFGAARRQNWDAYMYNSFLRRAEIKLREAPGSNPYAPTYIPEKVFTYTTTVPVYMSGVINPTTHWDASATYNENHTSDTRNFTKFNTGYNFYAFGKSPFTFNHGISLEYANSESTIDKAEMAALTTKLATESTPRFSKNISLGATNTTKMYHYVLANGSTQNYLDNDLNGKAIYTLSNRLRATFTQGLRTVFGKPGIITTDITNAGTTTQQYQSPVSVTEVPNRAFQTTTSLQLDWQPSARLSANLFASEMYYNADTGNNRNKTSVGTGIIYKLQFLTVSADARYEESSDEYNRYILKNSIKYTYSRNIDMFLNTIYTKSKDKQNTVDTVTGEGLFLEQGANFYLFKTNGITRKLFEINEVFRTGKGLTNNSLSLSSTTASIRSNELSLGLRYYPIRALTLSTGGKYSCADSLRPYVAMYYASAALTYQLFESSIDYTHGKNSRDGLVEKKLAINMKKRF